MRITPRSETPSSCSPISTVLEDALGVLAPYPGCRLAGGAVLLKKTHFKYVSCELDQLKDRYCNPTVERSRFNVASCVVQKKKKKRSWISRPPDRPVAFSLPCLQTLETRSTSYLKYYDLIEYHTEPLGSNLSFLRSPPASFTCFTGRRGAAGGRQPTAAKPPWYKKIPLILLRLI